MSNLGPRVSPQLVERNPFVEEILGRRAVVEVDSGPKSSAAPTDELRHVRAR